MSENKFTPGPWDIRTLENFGFNIVHYVDGDKFDIARVAKVSVEADAKLIAAAPDLLEALREFFTSGDFDIKPLSSDPKANEGTNKWLNKARSAIRKATEG